MFDATDSRDPSVAFRPETKVGSHDDTAGQALTLSKCQELVELRHTVAPSGVYATGP